MPTKVNLTINVKELAYHLNEMAISLGSEMAFRANEDKTITVSMTEGPWTSTRTLTYYSEVLEVITGMVQKSR